MDGRRLTIQQCNRTPELSSLWQSPFFYGMLCLLIDLLLCLEYKSINIDIVPVRACFIVAHGKLSLSFKEREAWKQKS
jgi:hypothetical protein